MSLIFVTKIRNFDENLLRFAGSVLQARVVTRNIFISAWKAKKPHFTI